MRDLNENLDDQFREAVDRYTLGPVDSKWDELSGRIVSIKRSPLADSIRSKYRKWSIWLAFLILLPVALVTLKDGQSDQKNSTDNINSKTNSSRHADSQTRNPAVRSLQAQSSANAEPQTISPAQANTPRAGQTALPLQENPVSSSSNQTNTSRQEKSAASVAVKSNGSPQAQTVTNRETASNGNTDQGNRAATGSAIGEDGVAAFGFSSSSLYEPATKKTSVGLAGSDALFFSPVYSTTGSSSLDKKEAASLTIQMQKNLPLQHLDIPQRQGIYLALVGGPLLTEVKNQGLRKTGYDFGFLAGYALNKKFSIETGLFYTHQYFYVSGKYYNEISGINYAASLEGKRSAFEIPLTLKYNLIRRAGGNFFVTAGASTFVGVSDQVLIQVAEGAIPPSVHFDYGVTSYLPSYVNVSIGYEYKIGKSANIRIEPYLQIPLNSNTGNSFKTESSGSSIRVFNAGIHIGISQFIHKK